jgi:hypothetical protein
MPFVGLPAWADACITAPVSTYTAPGFSCSIGDKTFTEFIVTSLSVGDVPNLQSITPFTSGNVFGLQLNLFAKASPFAQSLDVLWGYHVSSEPPIIGALLQLGGSTGPPTGTAAMNLLNEELLGEDGFVALGLSVASPPMGSDTTTETFAPIGATLNVLNNN